LLRSFEVSRQFWAYLVQNKEFPLLKKFIKSIPHQVLFGAKNISTKRFEALQANPLSK
jgi:malate dehydrogenase (quinone)